MAIKAVIFDLAGVILHAIRGTFTSQMAERLGVDEADVVRVMNDPVNDQWDKGLISDDAFYAHLLTELNLPMEKRAVLEKFVIDDFYVDQEMLFYIRELKKTFTTVLLTNFPAHVHDFMRTAWIMDGAFDHIIVSADVQLIKPDPRIYQLTLERIGCRAEEAVFIDDRIINVEGAVTVGMHGIHFTGKAGMTADLSRILKSAR